VARRRLTIKRLDPWSVLKFGALVNVALLGIFLLVLGVVWFIIERLQLVDQVCGIATDVGFTSCGVEAGNVFRAFALLGVLWVVVQTAVFVFFAFLHNLIADLTGGLVIGVVDDSPVGGVGAGGAAAGSGRQVTGGSSAQPAVTTDGGRRGRGPASSRGDGDGSPEATGRQARVEPVATTSTPDGGRSPKARPRRTSTTDDDLFADR
jgi:hypothetical protein